MRGRIACGAVLFAAFVGASACGDAGAGGGASSSTSASGTGGADPCATSSHCDDGLLDCGEIAFDCGGDCSACGAFDVATVCGPDASLPWSNPHVVSIVDSNGADYAGDVEEPEVRDFGGERWLFFNDAPADGNKDLFYAQWDAAKDAFVFRGPLGGSGVETAAVDGNPSLDEAGHFYFVSTRTYPNPTETIHGATLSVSGTPSALVASDIHRLTGLSRPDAPWVTQGVQVTWDGSFLYWDEAKFDAAVPSESDVFAAKFDGTGFVRLAPADQQALLANVDTPTFLEYAESISHDGLEIYFTRTWFDAAKPQDTIMCVMRAARPSLDVGFGPAVQVAATAPSPGVLMEAPSLSPDEKTLYYHRRGPSDPRVRLYAVVRP